MNIGQIGLIFDIVGAIMLFSSTSTYALRVNDFLMFENVNYENKVQRRVPVHKDFNGEKSPKHIHAEKMSIIFKRLGDFGIGFLIIGFAMQLAQTFIK